MAKNLPSIYAARLLHQSDLYYFSTSLLADLLDLDKRQAYRLLARLKAEGLVDEVEKGKYLYTNRMENKSLGSRLGYLLETCGYPTHGLVHSDGPVKLDPSRPRIGALISRWQVIVNLPPGQLFQAEGVA